MTDTEDQVLAPKAPKPRAKPPVRRKPPAPRKPNGENGGSGATTTPDLAALIRQNEALMARLERLEAGGMRMLEPEPRTRPEITLTEGMSDFTRGLAERTHEVPHDFGGDREPAYNVAPRLY